MQPLALLLVALPALAATVETAPVAPVSPVVLDLAGPQSASISRPALALDLVLPLGRVDAAATIRLPESVVSAAGLEQAARAAAASPASAPKVIDGLTALADGIAKDETPGGARTASLSGRSFDGFMALPESQSIPTAEVAAAQVAREIEEPPRILRERGIQGTVPVYGSARIPSPERARAIYRQAIEAHGRKPETAEGRVALKEARQALRNSKYYELARRFGELVARGGRGRIAIVTGGGPGIMEAANRGAYEAGGPSVGYNIKLPREQHPNTFITPGLSFEFEHFPSRKMNLRHGALAMVYFPGGFGTMDELFEVMTLMQTGKIPRRPIVLVGEKEYWEKILDFKAFARMGLISKDDLSLFKFAETAEEAWAIVRGRALDAGRGAAR